MLNLPEQRVQGPQALPRLGNLGDITGQDTLSREYVLRLPVEGDDLLELLLPNLDVGHPRMDILVSDALPSLDVDLDQVDVQPVDVVVHLLGLGLRPGFGNRKTLLRVQL